MKKLVSALAVATFVLGLTITAHAAKTIECKIVASKEDTVIMDCGKKARKMKAGDRVDVKKKPPEGC